MLYLVHEISEGMFPVGSTLEHYALNDDDIWTLISGAGSVVVSPLNKAEQDMFDAFVAWLGLPLRVPRERVAVKAQPADTIIVVKANGLRPLRHGEIYRPEDIENANWTFTAWDASDE